MGAAGRDFHDFNVYFRSRPEDRVVAFTAAQIPNIANAPNQWLIAEAGAVAPIAGIVRSAGALATIVSFRAMVPPCP